MDNLHLLHQQTADQATAGVDGSILAQIDFFAVLTLLESQTIVGGLQSVDDLRIAQNRLQNLLMEVNTKLLSTVGQSDQDLNFEDYKELVVMIGSNHAQDHDAEFEQHIRSVDAEFVVGPTRAPLSVSIENVKTVDGEDIRFECDLFVKEDPDKWPVATSEDRKCWEEYREETGIHDRRHIDFFFHRSDCCYVVTYNGQVWCSQCAGCWYLCRS